MDVICSNGTFSSDYLQWAIQHNVEIPLENSLYSIRDTIRTFNGLGIYLIEIINPIVEFQGITGMVQIEPNFSYKRFSTLSGEPLTIEEVLEQLKSIRLDIGLQLVSKDENEN